MFLKAKDFDTPKIHELLLQIFKFGKVKKKNDQVNHKDCSQGKYIKGVINNHLIISTSSIFFIFAYVHFGHAFYLYIKF